MHNRVSAGVSKLRLATLVNPLPGADQLGFGEPLHAHVRHSDHGRVESEPQEG
jgi:hypothetical protein